MLGSKLIVGSLLVVAWLGACSGNEKNQFACAAGQADCSCNADGTCASGLVCNDRHQCVSRGSPNAGRSGADEAGSDANAGIGGANESSGGTGGQSSGRSGTGGATGPGPAGGTSGEAGGGESAGMNGEAGASGGTSGTTSGNAGAGATSGSGGTDSQGGTGAGGMSVAGSGGAGTGGSAGSSGGAGTGGSASSSGGAGTGGSGGVPSNCTEITLPAMMTVRDLDKAPDFVDYVYRTQNNIGLTVGPNTADFFHVDFYGPGRGYDGDETGVFTLGTHTEANYQTCARCLVVDQDSDNDAEALFFASAGTLDLAGTSHQLEGFPIATLTDVTLVEVTIDGDNLSTPVPSGRCLHLASATLTFPADWTCDPGLYSTGAGGECDCGCGAPDGDCDDRTLLACDTCNCPGDAGNCARTSVDPTDNTVCR